MNLTIRTAREDDAAALLAIYAPFVRGTLVTMEIAVPTEAEFRRRIATIGTTYPYLVAEADGVPVGYAYAHRFHERAAYDWVAETTIYVSPQAHGRGVGRKLYETLFDCLREMHVTRAAALVTTANAPSLAFHAAMGYEVSGVVPDCAFKLGRWVGITTLSRSLLPPDAPLGAPEPLIPFPALPAESGKRTNV